jgi:hypothetical protein
MGAVHSWAVYGGIALAGAVAIAAVLRAVWRGIGLYRIWRAGPRPLRASAHRLWRDPGPLHHVDPAHGPGAPHIAPAPPFRFLEEHLNGSQACVSVRDGRGRRWRVKWGQEVRCETFAVRFAWACGYFAEVTYFVPAGTIVDAGRLTRARDCIDARSGAFTDARFELDDPAVRKMFDEHSWAWDENPFVGTAGLSGLKIVVMLLSNWDTKDRRDVARGSNTAIFEHRIGRWRREARYLLTDWGGAMGRWGSNVATRGRWDIDGFEQQTSRFVTGIKDGWVCFGYVGQRTADVARNIPVAHVRWFNEYVGRLTDGFLRDAMKASGATDEEARRFSRAIRDRIRQLQEIVETAAPLAARA